MRKVNILGKSFSETQLDPLARKRPQTIFLFPQSIFYFSLEYH